MATNSNNWQGHSSSLSNYHYFNVVVAVFVSDDTVVVVVHSCCSFIKILKCVYEIMGAGVLLSRRPMM